MAGQALVDLFIGGPFWQRACAPSDLRPKVIDSS
jgi:hypothetical protein